MMLTSNYDSVGTTDKITYIDDNLDNGRQYCYYVRSSGDYLDPGTAKEPY